MCYLPTECPLCGHGIISKPDFDGMNYFRCANRRCEFDYSLSEALEAFERQENEENGISSFFEFIEKTV